MSKIHIRFPEAFHFEYTLNVKSSSTVKDLYKILQQAGVCTDVIQNCSYITNRGLCPNPDDQLLNNEIYTFNFKLNGGKGGFGSMLRALGSQIEKTTNNEACRDLSGRRMRDVNNEKKMMEWVKQKAEKDRLKEKETIEKLERQLQRPKHFFNDPEYEKSLEVTTDSVEDALKTGLNANKRVSNLKSKSTEPPTKKSKLWLGAEDISDSSDSDSSNEDSVSVQLHDVSEAKNNGESSSSITKTITVTEPTKSVDSAQLD